MCGAKTLCSCVLLSSAGCGTTGVYHYMYMYMCRSPICIIISVSALPPVFVYTNMTVFVSLSSGLEYGGGGAEGGGKPSHSYRMRSTSRPTDRDLRDPATAQNTDYTPPTTRFKSGFSKK